MHVPEVLVPYMGGIVYMPFVRASKLESTDVAAKEKGGGDKKDKGPAVAKDDTTSATTSVSATTTASTGSAGSTTGPGSVSSAHTSTTSTSTLPVIIAAATEIPPELQPIVASIISKGEEIRVLKTAKVKVLSQTIDNFFLFFALH